MGWIFFLVVGLVIGIGIIVAAIQFWYVSLPIIIIGVVVHLYLKDMKQKSEEEARRLAEQSRQEEARRRDEERWRLEQQAYDEKQRLAQQAYDEKRRLAQQAYDAKQQLVNQRLFGFVTETSNILQRLPKDIDVAEHALDEAEREFAEGAFAPFWDAVERAATHLARFDLGIQRVRANSDSYKTEMKMLDSTPPPFPMNYTLPEVARTVDRMRCIVCLAQKDFHFATIYEQRKTNQLLVKGFTNLGQALSEMRRHIEASITALSGSISDLAASNQENAQALIVSSESLREQLQYDADERRSHEEQEREMLDNIQRRRKPRS